MVYYEETILMYMGELGWTNGWRVRLAISSNHAPIVKELHEQYGPVVRTGPNMLDLNIPSLIRTVYNTNGKWPKVSGALPLRFDTYGWCS